MEIKEPRRHFVDTRTLGAGFALPIGDLPAGETWREPHWTDNWPLDVPRDAVEDRETAVHQRTPMRRFQQKTPSSSACFLMTQRRLSDKVNGIWVQIRGNDNRSRKAFETHRQAMRDGSRAETLSKVASILRNADAPVKAYCLPRMGDHSILIMGEGLKEFPGKWTAAQTASDSYSRTVIDEVDQLAAAVSLWAGTELCPFMYLDDRTISSRNLTYVPL